MSHKSREQQVTRREAASAATQARIVETAERLFLTAGYGRTTIGAIAAEAGVAIQTIYNAVGGKAVILTRVFESTVAGPNAPRRVPELMRERAREAADAREFVRVLAAWFVEVHERTARLWRVIEEAAGNDPEVARFARERAHQRLRNYGEAAAELRRLGGLAPGMTDEDAAAVIWAVGHPQVYRALVLEAGWEPERYRQWVEGALAAALA